MPKVLVTDAEQGRIPLNITRSLGRKEIKVYVGGDMKIATPYYSSYCTKKVVYPSILLKPSQFKKFMLDYVKKEKFKAVFHHKAPHPPVLKALVEGEKVGPALDCLVDKLLFLDV